MARCRWPSGALQGVDADPKLGAAKIWGIPPQKKHTPTSPCTCSHPRELLHRIPSSWQRVRMLQSQPRAVPSGYGGGTLTPKKAPGMGPGGLQPGGGGSAQLWGPSPLSVPMGCVPLSPCPRGLWLFSRRGAGGAQENQLVNYQQATWLSHHHKALLGHEQSLGGLLLGLGAMG